MACKPPFKTAEANAKAYLRTKKVMDKFHNITDLVNFRKLSTKLRMQAKRKFGVDEQLFFEEQGGRKAVPNTDAFRKIDEANGLIFKQKTAGARPSGTLSRDVEDKIKNFLSQYGIGVTYVNSLKERGYDGAAIADITNKMITIARDEADATTLPEEAAHMAVELLGEDNPMVKRLMDKIESTELFDEVYQEYATDPEYQIEGKPNLDKIKKEAIGKAISNQIIKQQPVDNSITGTISRLWNRLLSMFKKVPQKALNKEIEAISGNIASDIINNTVKGDINNLGQGIFKQKSNKGQTAKATKEIKLAKSALKTLQAREKQIKHSKLGNEELLARTAVVVKELDFAIAVNQGIIGTGNYTKLVKEEVDGLLDLINRYAENKDTSLTLNTKTIADIYEFLEMHKPTIDEVVRTIEFGPEFRGRGDDVLALAKALQVDLQNIQNFADEVRVNTIKKVVEKEKETDYDVEELENVVKDDTSLFRVWLGSAKHAKDEVLRIAYNMIDKVKKAVDRYTIDVGKRLTTAQIALEQTGFKDFGVFYETFTSGENKGKKTGNIISRFNMGEFFRAKRAVHKRIVERLGLKEWTDIPIKEHRDPFMSKVIKEEWNKFYKDHTQVVDGEISPSNRYLNKNFASLSPAAKKYYDVLMEVKQEADKKLPTHYQKNNFRMPQIRKDTLERLKSKEQGIWANVKEVVKDSTIIREDETDFGHQDIVTNNKGEVIRMVPVHYVSRLKDMDNLSDDISSIYVAFAHMAESFKQKSIIRPQLELLQRQVETRQYVNTRNRKSTPGAQTNTYKMLSNLMETQLYEEGKRIQEFKFSVGDKQFKVNTTKVLDRFNSWIRRLNLQFNVFTHTANYIVGSAYSKVEDAAGVYTTQESKLWAETEIDKYLMSGTFITQMGKRIKTDKLALLFEYNSINKSATKVFKDLNYNTAAGRIISDSGVYATYEAVDFRVKGKIMLAVYDNYRLIDGKYMTKSQYKSLNKKSLTGKQISDNWKAARKDSLYNAYEVKNNKIVVKKGMEKHVTPEIINKVNNRINQVSDQVDGKLGEMDRANLYRNVWGRLILTHRGWLISGAEARWKHKGYNYSTGEMEEGYHRTFFNKILLDVLKQRVNLREVAKNYQNLDDFEKANIRKAFADIAFIISAMSLASILNGLAEGGDDDDFSLQFMAYMSSRVELEALAFSNPRELPQILRSPAAGINQMESIMDLATMLTRPNDEGTLKAFEEIEKGRYEGYTRLEKMGIKLSFLKNFYDFYAAEEKNRYLKQFVLN